MSTKKQRQLDKKRKAKRRRNLRSKKKESLAYSGAKYRTDELIPFIMATEQAIHEAFLISQRGFTDHDVRGALETMIGEIRQNRLLDGEQDGVEPGRGQDAGNARELIISNILFHWCRFFESQFRPSRNKAVGVLRTILSSVDTWSSVNPRSRGYLDFVGEFLRKIGAEVREVSREELAEMGISDQLPSEFAAEPPPADETIEPPPAEETEMPAKSRRGVSRWWRGRAKK